MSRTKVAIIGSGNIGTDLMFKVHRLSESLEVSLLVGIDPESPGLARARRLGLETTDQGVTGFLDSAQFDSIDLIFDATSASAHRHNAESLLVHGKTLIDLTPAALGPYVVPSVNLDAHLDAKDVNMVTCGGQATIPIVAAIADVVPVLYAEIVASIASKSAGPGTRSNIDEFTETTAAAIRQVGRAAASKAIIVLNPAEPPMIMRDTVQALIPVASVQQQRQIADSIERRVAEVADYVPGYRLKQSIQFHFDGTQPDLLVPPGLRPPGGYTRVSAFLEVEGAGMYLPPYAGNLDIMTSAALRTAERMLSKMPQRNVVA